MDILNNLLDFMNSMKNTIKFNFNIAAVFDILVVAYLLYAVYKLFKQTRGEQLLKGLLLLIIMIPISHMLGLTMINFLLTNTFTISITIIVVVFQPEIRRGLETLGRSSLIDKFVPEEKIKIEATIEKIVKASRSLAQTRTGALIVIERKTGLGEVLNTGIKINGLVSSEILENIFVVNTPLHDGAVIIKNDVIVAAGCVLPITHSEHVSKHLGTRHRAAIGISENSDAIAIVVSEETGKISIAIKGNLSIDYDEQRLTEILKMMLYEVGTEDASRGGFTKWVKNHLKKTS